MLVDLAADGSFRIDDVPAGTYRVAIRVNGADRNRNPALSPFHRLSRQFTIPPIPGGRSDEVFDLGALPLRPRVELKVGEPAPNVEVTTIDGKKLALPGDYRGKFLLLDFGAIWNDQSYFQVVRLNDVRKRFGDDPRFAILSLVLAPDDAEARAFVKEKDEPWPQAIIGPLSNPIADAYGIDDENIQGAILIGPDGKVIAKDLYYNKIGEAVEAALKRDVK